MKHKNIIIIFIFLLLLCSNIQSQGLTNKDIYCLTGTVAMSYTKSKLDSKNYAVLINPTFSYFIQNNFELGVLFNYQYNEESLKSYYRIDRIFGLGPSINLYFGETESKPYVGVSYVFSESITHNHDILILWEQNYFDIYHREYGKLHSLNLSIGYLVKVVNNIAISPLLQYQISGSKFSELGEQNTLFFGMQLKTFL